MAFESKRYLPIFAVLLSLTACSTQTYYRTISFFFDGVPDPDIEKLDAHSDSLFTVSEDSIANFRQVQSSIFIHQPYLEKQCASCHNQSRMGSQNDSQPELCYQCHTDPQSTCNFEHGPAAAGYCTECHNPHFAKHEYLLIQTGVDLCFSCHNAILFSESVFHSISEVTVCIECHNPHGSNNYSLLLPGTCFQCHDSFTERFNVIHGPVNSNMCSECHTSHLEESENLLKKEGQDLCFNCHDSRRLLEDDTHSYISETRCTECHNPHGGEDRFMFN